MKKNVLLSLLMLFCMSVMSQEKGLYLTVSGGSGPTGYKYNIQGVNHFATPKNELKVGGQAALGVSYYFTKHFGISTGIGVSHYRSYAKLLGGFEDYDHFDDNYAFHLGNYIDNDFDGHPTLYNLRVRTRNWMEYQSGKFIEVPLLLNLQKKFGKSEFFGIYLGLGAKFMIPIRSEYEIKDKLEDTQAGLNVYGYDDEPNMYMGRYDQPPLDQHAFGVIYNPSERLTDTKGKLDYKFNVALVAEGGFLLSFSRRVDLVLGAFIDYGISNLKRKTNDTDLFTCPGQYMQNAEDNVGKGIVYHSITATNFVKKVSTLSYGGKIGLRIKLGKLSEKEKDNEPIYIPVRLDEDSTILTGISDKISALDSMMKEVLEAVNKKQPAIVETQDDKKDQLEHYYLDDDLNILFESIYFDLNKAVLKSESITILNDKIDVLNKYPNLRLVILGNTCDIGKDYYNYELGARRADAAKKYLTDHGIAPERIETTTHAKYLPELPNTSESNREHNRRDDFRPLFPKKALVPK
jgi:outer membrane protein OmpA-like peptidoglycan-associated protein